MAENVLYKGKTLSLGTEFSMWHVSYTKLFEAYKAGHLAPTPGGANLHPAQYLAPDSVFRFRFPFPEEDDMQLGEEVDFRFVITVEINNGTDETSSCHIMHQVCRTREDKTGAFLATLYFDEADLSMYLLKDIVDARCFARQIIKHHILPESDQQKIDYYRQVIKNLLKGYHMCIDYHSLELERFSTWPSSPYLRL